MIASVAGLGGAACEQQQKPAKEPAEATAPAQAPAEPAEPAHYVGSAACAECHAEAALRWRGSEHARAMQKATPETVLGDFSGRAFRDGPVTWKFDRREGFRARSEGAERGAFEVVYTIGVDPLQQYLVAFPDGRLQVLHLAWDARRAEAGGQRWFSLHPARVAAGHPAHWKSPAMSWNATCGECHVTGFRKGFDVAANRYDSTWAELGVGCEACHGAGSRHVDWARAGATGSASRGLEAPIELWRPISGEPRPSREVEACAGCHSQRAQITEQPRAGDPFLDDYDPALLDSELYYDDGQVAALAYEWGSFVQTRKYAAGVRCSDCHDPHSSRLRAEGNALCGTCHEPARFDSPAHHHHTAPPTPTCVDCHMAEHTVMSIDAQRDHGFHVPRPDQSARIGAPDACGACHAKRGAEWAAKAVAEWRGNAQPRPHFAERLHARQSGGSEAGNELLSLIGDAQMPAIARATALIELSVGLWRDQVEKPARASDPLLRLGAARASVGLSPSDRALAVGRLLDDPLRAVRIEAANALADLPDGDLPEAQRTARSRALDEYRAALATMADSPEAHVSLAVLFQRRGDPSAAEASYLTALRLVDDYVPAYAGLAELYGAQGRDEDGAKLLHRGLARVPDTAELHYALGMLLVRQQKIEPALKELSAAARLGTDDPYFAYAYALALNEQKQPARALAVLRKAAEHHPFDQNLLGATAEIARDAGRFDEALAAANRLAELFPNQPEPHALVEDIENRRAGGPGMVTAPATTE